MNEELIRAKIALYRELHKAASHGPDLSDVELSVFSLLASDVHIKMKIDGKFPNF